jgi:hypothetical protein
MSTYSNANINSILNNYSITMTYVYNGGISTFDVTFTLTITTICRNIISFSDVALTQNLGDTGSRAYLGSWSDTSNNYGTMCTYSITPDAGNPVASAQLQIDEEANPATSYTNVNRAHL